MTKLNQIVAVVNGKKTEALNALTQVHRKCAKDELFNGLYRSYRPFDEDGESFPDEHKPVFYTVKSALADVQNIMTDFLNVVATQEYNNANATADVVVDGVAILEKVPVTYLLFLEKQLTDFKTFVTNLPVLQAGETWELDSNNEFYVTPSYNSNRNKKVLQHKVVYEATEHHPAQVEKWTEDLPVGVWKSQKISGAMRSSDKVELLNRVKKLIDAVKFAREQANSITIDMVDVSSKLFNYLLK